MLRPGRPARSWPPGYFRTSEIRLHSTAGDRFPDRRRPSRRASRRLPEATPFQSHPRCPPESTATAKFSAPPALKCCSRKVAAKARLAENADRCRWVAPEEAAARNTNTLERAMAAPQRTQKGARKGPERFRTSSRCTRAVTQRETKMQSVSAGEASTPLSRPPALPAWRRSSPEPASARRGWRLR